VHVARVEQRADVTQPLTGAWFTAPITASESVNGRVGSRRPGDGGVGHKQAQFLDELVHVLAGLRSYRSQCQFGEQAEAAGLGSFIAQRVQQCFCAGEVAAVFGGDDSGGLLGAEEDRPGVLAEVPGPALSSCSGPVAVTARE
jgi:hypothetical protein